MNRHMNRTYPFVHPILILAITLLSKGTLNAQESDAFTTLDIQLGYASNFNRTEFHNYWEAGQGVRAAIETPFYVGKTVAGAQVISYESKMDRIPGFESYYLFLGWGMEKLLTSGVTITAGFQAGNDLMIFKAAGGIVRESELEAGIFSGIAVTLPHKYELQCTISRQVLNTHRRIVRDFITLGIGYTIATPTWLRDFLE